jgi:hypothetical protein
MCVKALQDHPRLSRRGPMAKFASILFSAAFVAIFIGFLCLGAYGVVCVVFFIIRIFRPDFGTIQTPATIEAKSDHKEVKLLAIDYLVQEKLRKTKERQKRMEELLNCKTTKPNLEWTLEKLTHEITAKPRSTEPEGPIDLWQICRMEQGRRRYLAVWRSTREGGLRTGWTPSSKYGIKTSAEASLRWIGMLPGTFASPCNAASRQKIRIESAKLREEISNATA